MIRGEAPDLLLMAARCRGFTPEALERVFHLLPETQRDSIAKNRRPEDRRRRLAARALLSEACAHFMSVPPEAVLGALHSGPQGRLCLSGPLSASGAAINISHSGEYVACAVARVSICGSVGLDVEEVRPLDPEDFRKVFTARELSGILAAPDPDDELIRLWTIKEAVLKCHGLGFLADPLEVDATPPGFAPLPELTHTQRRLSAADVGRVYWLTAVASRPWASSRVVVGAI